MLVSVLVLVLVVLGTTRAVISMISTWRQVCAGRLRPRPSSPPPSVETSALPTQTMVLNSAFKMLTTEITTMITMTSTQMMRMQMLMLTFPARRSTVLVLVVAELMWS